MTKGNSFIVMVSNSGLTAASLYFNEPLEFENTRTRYLTHVELAKNTGTPDSSY